MNYFSIDRIENGFAVCIDDKEDMLEISLDSIDGKAAEGDIIFLQNGKYKKDEEETKKRRAAFARRFRKLFS
ncbi:MAG: DUF3006 domain-containing protein [Oscillospiraceae bacterium]|nr:DUF3006 domain-containing protein [Oscillospiraceae bacterium]